MSVDATASVQHILNEQHTIIKSIHRAVDNFKKLGRANVTHAIAISRLKLLHGYWTRCRTLHQHLLNTATDVEKGTVNYFVADEFGSAEDAFLEASDFINDWVARLAPLANPASPAEASEALRSQMSDAASSIRLPKIELPHFSGDLLEWENYRDVFSSLIHKNQSLESVQKLHYLKASLTGEAGQLLKGVALTNANYNSSWDSLQARYDNQRVLIAAHLQSLTGLQSVSTESYKDLRRLRDGTRAALTALSNLGRPVSQWDDLIVYLTVQKLDIKSRKEWELELGSRMDFPKFSELDTFLDSRIRALEAVSTPSSKGHRTEAVGKTTKGNSVRSHVSNSTSNTCPLCSEKHHLTKCSQFKEQSQQQRIEIARSRRCCFNCLTPGHMPWRCPSKSLCSTCQRKHHTMIHGEGTNGSSRIVNAAETATASGGASTQIANVSVHCTKNTRESRNSMLLATAWVLLRASNGNGIRVRALLDQGSEATFVTESIVQLLRAPTRKIHTSVVGISGSSAGTVRSDAPLSIEPVDGQGPCIKFNGLILGKLTSYVPPRVSDGFNWNHLRDLNLADPDPSSSHSIDLLIGADIFGSLLLSGVRQGSACAPTAQQTIFGWILSGPCSARPGAPRVLHHGVTLDDLHSSLSRFWELEELPRQTLYTEEETQCEEHFVATHKRCPDGRYVVRLPFKSGPPIAIGDSLRSASKQFAALERRLLRNPEQHTPYKEFMHEYLELGHMERVLPAHNPAFSQVSYLPHHPVIKPSSQTTRLRVVFNASHNTSNGASLNSNMLKGPRLQRDLSTILLNWWMYRVVLTADIAKMYRQIWVDKQDVDYQRILWRDHPEQAVGSFRLLTVTYGTAAAPYLAVRVLLQLAQDEQQRFPVGARILREHFYIDDVLFGADSPHLAQQQQFELIKLLESGGFHLRKWASNWPSLLAETSSNDHELAIDRSMGDDETVKILGLVWSPNTDLFRFHVTHSEVPIPTKRVILSIISRIFDPLGWLGPCLVVGKILMQDLWIESVGWDSALPEYLSRQWSQYYDQLPTLQELSIPRWTGYVSTDEHVEVHAFSDASCRAYAAVVYLRMLRQDIPQVRILASRTKVAPIKSVSIPRLELCGAVLMARLVQMVILALNVKAATIFAWTDSTVVLAWLSRHPSSWRTFIANRVADIQTRIPSANWGHVPSSSNPADCASRGISAAELVNHHLWWEGPNWLRGSPECWPRSPATTNDPSVLEEQTNSHSAVQEQVEEWDLPDRISSWPRLLRITAYCLLFIYAARKGPISEEPTSPLVSTIALARRFWLRHVQSLHFTLELHAVRSGNRLARSSQLIRLHPVIDQQGLLRVGGRLQWSGLPYDERHPVILPRHRISEMIIAQAHACSLHGGPQLTLRLVRQQYWILSARTQVKMHIYRCVTCTRERASKPEQLMGNLPSSRVIPSRPFSHTGLDYAGPISVRSAKGRGQHAHKAYIAVFVCFSTRAVHLELVGDLSTESFLAALRRFTARRGIPVAIYSDNGTTFHGADRELRQHLKTVARDRDLSGYLATDGISWHFMPPHAPHFGGLWEAGVKSTKRHIRRIVGAHKLTFEEFTTLLAQIEACLNSRPIGPLTSDPNDYAPLTPGHFLIGAPLLTIPEPSVLDLNENRLSRWRLVRRMLEQFWRRWSSEYLHSLQQRTKWSTTHADVQPNTLVLIRNDLLPPSLWQLGRILQCHKGTDGHTRVVTIKTAQSVCKRPITKVCILPVKT